MVGVVSFSRCDSFPSRQVVVERATQMVALLQNPAVAMAVLSLPAVAQVDIVLAVKSLKFG
jgi:hypothetical protein